MTKNKTCKNTELEKQDCNDMGLSYKKENHILFNVFDFSVPSITVTSISRLRLDAFPYDKLYNCIDLT
jgi:hypothetical protein